MNAIRIPRDIYSYSWFIKLERQIGRGPACYVVHDLFYRLTYEAEDLGASGFVSRVRLLEWLQGLDLSENLHIRIQTDLSLGGLLEERDGGGRFFCPTFARYNHEAAYLYQGLDASARRALFSKALAGAEDVKKIVAMLAMTPYVWKDSDGKQVTPEELEATLGCIRLADGITGQKSRKAIEDFGEGLVQTGSRVLHIYGKDLIHAVLREYMTRRHEPEIPQTTVDIFAQFEILQLKLMPEGGWIRT